MGGRREGGYWGMEGGLKRRRDSRRRWKKERKDEKREGVLKEVIGREKKIERTMDEGNKGRRKEREGGVGERQVEGERCMGVKK